MKDMDVNMLKDKPTQYLSAESLPKRRRTWLISILATLALLYYFLSTPSSKDTTHPFCTTKLDWSKYAYSSYATDQHYLCNSLMLFDSLESLGSKANRLLFYPKSWDLDVSSSKDRVSQLLVMARDKYNVDLKPTGMYTLERPGNDEDDESIWDASINKLHAFTQGQYDRIIHLDSDITLLRNIDHLFFLPSARVAMPRAYWLLNNSDSTQTTQLQPQPQPLTSSLLILEPSSNEATTLFNLSTTLSLTPSTLPPNQSLASTLLSTHYSTSALILPHQNLYLLTSEFRLPPTAHTTYLSPSPSTSNDPWNPHTILHQTSIIHFSDSPIPKPWIATPNTLLRDLRPACEVANGTPDEKGCEDRKVWMDLYDGFRRRRRDVCRLLSVPAPEWPPRRKPKMGRGKKEGEEMEKGKGE